MCHLFTINCLDFFYFYKITGGVATEVGSRAHNLHIQGVMEMHYPKSPAFKLALTKFIKDLLPDKKGHKITCKPLCGSQDFSTMIGYITKDQDQAHFQVRQSISLTYDLLTVFYTLLLYLRMIDSTFQCFDRHCG